MNEGFLNQASAWINTVLGPPLRTFFHPIDEFLAPIYLPWAKIVTIGFFIGTMIWIFTLQREYTNKKNPADRHIWTDLRLWVVISMLPHIFVYLIF